MCEMRIYYYGVYQCQNWKVGTVVYWTVDSVGGGLGSLGCDPVHTERACHLNTTQKHETYFLCQLLLQLRILQNKVSSKITILFF